MSEVIGIGTDLCRVARIQKALEREHFLLRVFTREEREYLEMRGRGRAQSAAAMFAAKEAAAKALGTGFSQGVMPEQIEVFHEEGRPCLRLYGAALLRMQALHGKRFFLSLTHEGDYAQAFAVLTGGLGE